MEIPNEAKQALRVDAKRRRITIEESSPLGFGQDGMVWLSTRETAVKWLERERAFQRERDAYLQLQANTPEQIAESVEESRQLYDDQDWQAIEDAILDLKLIGIIYLDIKPANIRP